MMRQVIGHSPSAKTIERLTRRIGAELAARGGAASGRREVIVADVAVAVVSCDGGRIRTRAANAGPGVHEAAWRETKNSSFERTKAPAESSKDPCATLPDTFRRVAFGMPMKREDGRLQDDLRHRPGCVFTRRLPPVVAT
jgi:hypothetical protein